MFEQNINNLFRREFRYKINLVQNKWMEAQSQKLAFSICNVQKQRERERQKEKEGEREREGKRRRAVAINCLRGGHPSCP